ncbi:MAG: divalent-cation tolerance protein CutA [Verrucomicrobia bacterium]|nr:divalent-cation tolerance protein CutA [Verrucomicrobiota bacterium]
MSQPLQQAPINSGSEVVIAFSAAGSPDEARRIANVLVAERLAACVNIVDNMHSVYRWRGSLEVSTESLVLIKTRANLLAALESRLRDLHSYEVPELITVPIAAGSQAYLEWIFASTNGG